MIEVRKSNQNQNIAVIRAASGHELSNYEKWKLEQINVKAEENKINVVNVNGQPLQITNKEVNIDLGDLLGDLAFKDNIRPEDISTDLFYIQCELD